MSVTNTAPQPGGDYVLEARGLSKSFGGFHAVRDVNLKVRRGSVHALIGPNGAGKTTCFNLLTKTLAPTSGQVLLDGQDITGLRSAQVARQGLVRSFQISATFPHLTCLENVRVALQSAYGIAFRFWRSLRALDSLNDRAMQLLEQVGLKAQADVLATELSYGKKRALEIATTLALSCRPRIVTVSALMSCNMRESTSSSTSVGMASSASTNRISSESTQPPK